MTIDKDNIGEFCLPSSNLDEDINFFENTLNFSLEEIFPAEEPEVAILEGHGIRIRLETKTNLNPGRIRLYKKNVISLDKSTKTILAPNGTEIEIVSTSPTSKNMPSRITRHLKRFDNKNWLSGRAGMLYRGICDDVMNGHLIASHIKIPHGGPVPDKVHYHEINFQIIFCFNGWAKIAYENQGDPIILSKYDCILQPPRIRHKVIESSDNLEVIEVTIPGRHSTKIDNQMQLPNDYVKKESLFGDMKFCYFNYKNTKTKTSKSEDFVKIDTGIELASNGFAAVKIIESKSNEPIEFYNNNKILLYYILEGDIELKEGGLNSCSLSKYDSVFIFSENIITLVPESFKTKILEVSLF